MVKTLNVKVNGKVEFNNNELYIHTDTSDANVPHWALADIEKIISDMSAEGCIERHYENNGVKEFQHCVYADGVHDGHEDFPEVFIQMQLFTDQYMQSFQETEAAAAKQASVEAEILKQKHFAPA